MSGPDRTTSPSGIEVFYSYSHVDELLEKELQKHLSLLKRQGIIREWHDRKITAGTEWRGQIDQHLNSAGMILLLISADFLASDYCYDIELKRALERHHRGEARVIPVILREVDLQTDEFARLQCLPTDGKPMTSKSWSNQDEAFTIVAKGIREAVDELACAKAGADQQPAPLVSGHSGQPENRPNNLPFLSLGPLFKGRADFLAKLTKDLASQDGHAATIVARQAIHGLGGVGKTRAAVEYAREHEKNYTAILFVSAPTAVELRTNLANLAGLLGIATTPAVLEQMAAVLHWLAINPGWLLILEGVDSEDAAREIERLLVKLRSGHVLITSRISNWGRRVEAMELNVLDETDAVSFLLERASNRRKSVDDRATATQVALELGYLALGLEQAGTYIDKLRLSFSDYLARWSDRRAELLAWHDVRLMGYPEMWRLLG